VKGWDALPEVPAIAETVPGYEVNVVFGISEPPKIVEILNKSVTMALTNSKIKVKLSDLDGVPMPMLPAACVVLPSLPRNGIGTSELDPFRSSIPSPWPPL
jgi:Tripartite tricarboxylate transporter family receptor